MILPFHGNYVGPGWSAGKFQNSVVDDSVPAIDEFDEAGRKHDAAYFRDPSNRGRSAADWQFVRDTKGLGVKAELARSLVALQALGRDTYSYLFDMAQSKGKKNPGRKPKGKKKKNQTRGRRRPGRPAKAVSQKVMREIAPRLVSDNSSVKSSYTSVARNNGGASKGCELIGTVTVASSSTQFTNLFNQNIAPQFLSGTRIQKDASRYEKYRYNWAKLVLVSKCSNTTNGSVVAYFERDVGESIPLPTLEVIQKATGTYGGLDLPIKNTGYAFMKKHETEPPYYTDSSSPDDDVTAGQARALVFLNATGSSVVSSGSLVCFDVMLEYDIEWFVPTNDNVDGDVAITYNNLGTGVSTTNPWGTAYESYYTLPNYSYNNAGVFSFSTIPGRYYKAEFYVAGSGISGYVMSITNQAGLITIGNSAGGTSNNGISIWQATGSTCSVTISGGSYVTPGSAFFDVTQYLYVNPTNPIAAPMSARRKRMPLATAADSAMIEALVQSILAKKKCYICGQCPADHDSSNCPKQTFALGNMLTPIDECYFCKEIEPDHLGRNCPQNPRNRGKSPSVKDRNIN